MGIPHFALNRSEALGGFGDLIIKPAYFICDGCGTRRAEAHALKFGTALHVPADALAQFVHLLLQ
jgi:hypothetical protein